MFIQIILFSALNVNKKKGDSFRRTKIYQPWIFLSLECREYRRIDRHSPHSRNCHHKLNPLLGYRPAIEREFPHTVR